MKNVLLLCALLAALSGSAQRDTVRIDPCLQLSFPTGTWMMKYDYYLGSFYIYSRYPDIWLMPHSWPFKVSTAQILSDFTRQEKSAPSSSFIIDGCHVSRSEPFETNLITDSPVRIQYTIFKARGEFSAMLNLTAPPSHKRQMDTVMRQLCRYMDILSPTEMDTLEGWPVHDATDTVYLAKEVARRNAEIQKLFGIPDSLRETEKLFLPGIQEDLAKKMFYHYSNERFYRYDQQLKSGHHSFDEFLDFYLEGQRTEDDKMYDALDGGVHGEYSDAFAAAVDSFVRKITTIPAQAGITWHDSDLRKKSDSGLYDVTINIDDLPDHGKAKMEELHLRFQKINGKWSHTIVR